MADQFGDIDAFGNAFHQRRRRHAARRKVQVARADGVYITELIGHGVNPVTGDYSRGASGFLIKDGVLAGPIAEFTIAGNLIDMFAALIPANDLEFRHGTNAPTLRIDGMTVASS